MTVGFNRKTLKPIKMSDGVVLPANIIVGAATDPLCHDPERYTNPEVFDHLRFYNNPKPTKDANDEQFTTLSIDSLAFGFGRLACPGRWYASAQVKLILATLLLDYDVQFPEGQVTRPPNLSSDERILPDRTQALRVRRR
jgi:cytochrome P450